MLKKIMSQLEVMQFQEYFDKAFCCKLACAKLQLVAHISVSVLDGAVAVMVIKLPSNNTFLNFSK